MRKRGRECWRESKRDEDGRRGVRGRERKREGGRVKMEGWG